MTFYSGGARGADSYWQHKLEDAGHEVIVYRAQDIQDLYDNCRCRYDLVEEQYRQAVKDLGRHYMSVSSYAGRLVRRDMLQVENSKAVFAVGYVAESFTQVSGGTGYAVARAIRMELPIYIFDQDCEMWLEYDYDIGMFQMCKELPVLVDKSAVIGTRQLTRLGEAVITDIVKRSFNKQ
jgi:hypothetical protein